MVMEKTEHILVVDDDVDIRELLSQFLQKHNFKVSTARDGREMNAVLKRQHIDLIVLGVNSKGIEWASEQISKVYKNQNVPNLLMLTKGLSIYENRYELLVDKLKRLLASKGVSKVDISAVGGPCLAAGLANKVHTSVVIANKKIKVAKKIADMLNTKY